MAFPQFVGAGAGAERLTTGSFTVSKTGCTAGNLIIMHLHVLGATGDWGGTGPTNVEALDGTDNDDTVLRTGGEFLIACGRVMTSGTCSWALSVGASGEDVAARMYEFSGAALGSLLADVFENGLGTSDTASANDANPSAAPVDTNGSDRLALNFLALESAQAVDSFTNETTVNWEEAVPEYVGSTLTLQLQTTTVPSAAVFQEGNDPIGVSTVWLSIATALIPAPVATGGSHQRVMLMGLG